MPDLPTLSEAMYAFATPDQPVTAYLVIDPHGGGKPSAFLDVHRAHEFARNTGCVVPALPVVADYRTDGTP